MTTETEWDDATLVALADGELKPATALQIEEAASRDAALAARIAGHVALREQVRQAYATIVDEPVPDRLLAMLKAGDSRPSPVVSLEERRARPMTRTPARRWSWPEWSAMAASLLVGVFATLFLARPQPLGVSEGALVAQGELANALSAQLASTQSGSESVQIGLSYRNRDGAFCRTFQFQETAGLACRQAANWRVEAVSTAAAIPEGGTFRTAAATLPPALLAAVEQTIDGDAFDADAERAARDEGWKQVRPRD